jgi:hypothetical protein
LRRSNPASAVRGPKHVVKTGKTAVLDGKEWRRLIDAIPTDTVRDRRQIPASPAESHSPRLQSMASA